MLKAWLLQTTAYPLIVHFQMLVDDLQRYLRERRYYTAKGSADA